MRVRTALLLVVLAVGATSLGFAQTENRGGEVAVSRVSGGSIRTDLGHGIVLNKESTLQREWIVLNHDSLPLKFKGTPGVRTIYESGRGYSGSYRYLADLEIQVDEPITALEIRFLTFDVWGEHGRSLKLTEIKDYAVGTHKLNAEWNLFSENEASECYASIAYVSRIRTKSGKVLASDVQPVVDEARKFSTKFSASDLEEEEPKP